MHSSRLIAPIVLALMVLDCASSGTGTRSGGSRRDRISAEELAEVVDNNAYDVVSRLRPTWLQARGRRATPAVFRDDLRIGTNIESLRSIRLDNVLEIRYINPSDATTRWGTGFTGGAIQIITRR